ncbi:hypothetical protein EYB26_003825 [Talaromyces marneffei]|uniref:Neuroligin-3 n=1 Tax=Talaromyces marneffei PM1 TaxID=1077442 RepID=A0A093VD57_TALMA|nr:uncharacterized protein EYB26_003825 [Talaromyces marneffei]QGA16158.1 hypothetical protein EYB26_003825 [Talaromyces marneffei]
MTTYSCAWPSGMAYIPASSPCGPINETNPVVSCCADGDFCLSDNICAYTSHSNVGGSGYYSAGCSDGTLMEKGSSSACSNRCADTGLPDVVYDSSSGSWKCCGGNESERKCQSPTNETFIGGAPSNLFTIWVAGSSTTIASTSTSASTSTTSKTTSPSTSTSSLTSTSTSSTSSTSTTSTTISISSALSTTMASATTTPTPTTSPTSTAEIHTPNTSRPSELSVAAKTGIGIGAGVLVLVLLAFISLYFHHRRRRQRAVKLQDIAPTKGYPMSSSSAKTLYELPPTPKPQELPPNTRPLAELY